MYKPRVVFPFVEAGFGHIMAERSIADAFEKKYGDLCEVVRTNFYKEANTKATLAFEQKLCEEVRNYNRFNAYGYFMIGLMNFWGTNTSSWFVVKKLIPGAYEDSMEYMYKLAPDMIVSTHWATNYLGTKMKSKPLTVMYGPDAHLSGLFRGKCDMAMISIPKGYHRARRLHYLRYNKKNLKLVPTAIRQEAFEIERDKQKLRKKLGIEDKFTVLLMEGGYGIGLTENLCKQIIEADLPINLIAVCGSNHELYEHLSTFQSKGNLGYYPRGFCDNILELIAASDLYMGKSGSGLLEPAFFHVPIVVTHSANTVEKRIADHYVKDVGCAIKIFNEEACVEFICEAMQGCQEYEAMKAAHGKLQPFGAEGIADEIFKLLNERYHIVEVPKKHKKHNRHNKGES